MADVIDGTWETINQDTGVFRMKVPSGWLYKIAGQIIFVPAGS